MINTGDTSLHHKFSIGGRSLSCFLLMLFLLIPQDALALGVGDRVIVQNTGSDGLRIRSGAGTGYAEIGKVYDGDKGTIVSGPTGNVYTWWRVNWDSSSKPTGWSAERDYQNGTVWLARYASVVKPSISSVSDASATEGNRLSFTVRLSASTSQTETYYYSTFYGGGATAERGDYDGAAEESISVRSGRSSFTVRISTNEDADYDDETFYLYVTGEANHPNTTPGSSNNRGTGTIRDDDSAPPISQISIGDAEATEGNTITFTVILTPAPTSSVTYYYATYQGTARNTAQKKDYDGKFATALPFNSGETSKTIQISTIEDTEVESDEQFSIYITDAASKHPASGTPTDYLATAIGTIRDNDSTTTPVTPTPPNPSVPSGTYKYTFSLDNTIYTVVSENRYSQASSRSTIEDYIAGLRIYNNRNELVRPANNILFQLIAAHASACVINSINFDTTINGIDEAIRDILVFNEKFREAAGLDEQSEIISIIDAAKLGAEIGWDLGSRSAGAATSFATGVGIANTVLGFYARKKVEIEKKEIAMFISDFFFLTSLEGLKLSKIRLEELKKINLSSTISINELSSKMILLDYIVTDMTGFRNIVPAGQHYAQKLYPELTLSGLNKRIEQFNRWSYENFSPISSLLDKITLNHIMTEASATLGSWDINLIKNSPFDVFVSYRRTIDDFALNGTRNADIMRNFAPGAKLSGGSGNDWMYSEHVVTVMSGEDGNDYLFGGTKDDVLTGGPGNDELRGGRGQDIAGFSGSRANYDIRWDSAREWLTVSSSTDGSDRVYRDIESLYFRDGTLATSDIAAPSRNLAPILAGNIEDQVAFAGDPFEYYIPANLFVDPDGDRLTWRVSGLPSWLNFNSTTRLLSGTPTTNDVGNSTITVRVTGSSDSETFTLSVIKPNSLPVLTVPSASYVVDEDEGWTSLSGLSVTDADNDELTVVVGVEYGQLRATGTMVVDLNVSSDDILSDVVGFRKSSPGRINSALATLEYKPANDWESGRDVLILLVTDSIVETPVIGFTSIYSDTKPVFSGTVSNQNYTVGTEISTLTLPEATGGQAPLMYSLTPTVPGLTFNASTRTLSGTPPTAGTHAMIYKVTDASGSTDTEAFVITVEVAGLAADFNGDGRVDLDDYLLFFAHYTLSQGDAGYDARYDLDGNGIVGVMDFLLFVNSYGEVSS